jgi:hypothetical protein
LNQKTIEGFHFNQNLFEIANKKPKVYGPSKKNVYEAGADLGLMNLVLLSFPDFIGRTKKAMVKINSDLES